MIECPTGAIHREVSQGNVVINDQTCIGCSACANNCPYGAIRMVEIRHPDGQFIRDNETQLPIVKATKCDLCVDQHGGPACQRACPHGAMVRVDMQDVKSLADWLKR
jgi:Fe-S-cluster-containing hydrogenase component 2